MLYALNIYSDVCQLYLNNTTKKSRISKEMGLHKEKTLKNYKTFSQVYDYVLLCICTLGLKAE